MRGGAREEGKRGEECVECDVESEGESKWVN
jgi:hypothetical protein